MTVTGAHREVEDSGLSSEGLEVGGAGLRELGERINT